LAASVGELSEEFLLMNDDFFMLEPFNGAEFPFYALKGSNGGVDGQLSFHIHAPVRFKKEWYLSLPLDLNAKGRHSIRTFYANFYKAPPTFCDDFVLRTGEGMPEIASQIKKWPCFSISDSSMQDKKFMLWLKKRYGEPSRFETALLHTKDFTQSGVLA
jgi:hypothetical protein